MSLIATPEPAGSNTTDTGSAARREPAWFFGEVPVYKAGHAPARLRSETQITRGLGLRLAPGQRPVCYVTPFYNPDDPCALYDPADALPVARSAGAEWAWRTRRTCPRCGKRREYVVRGSQCGVCRRGDLARAAALRERTCEQCHRHGRKPYPQVAEGWYLKRLCRSCTAQRRRELAVLLAEAVLCPGGCEAKTAAKKAVLAWSIKHHRAVQAFTRIRCAPCGEVYRAEQDRLEAERRARWEQHRAEEAERERRQREARANELAELRAWAAGVLADPDAVILDTETTGLHESARILEIAVTTVRGETLLDTLVNPGEPIPAEATDIHSVTDEMVAGAPPFGEILPALEAAVRGKRVLIYNREYDVARLVHESRLAGPQNPAMRALDCDFQALPALRWMSAARWEDAMEPYSDWYGDWSDWHGNYRWQPLDGGHRALGDCRAVVDCLRAMTRPASVDDEEEAA